MYAQHAGHERDSVTSVFGLCDIGAFGLAGRRSDASRQIHGGNARNLEGQSAFASDFRLGHSGAFAFDSLRLRVGSFARHFDGVRRSVYVVVGKLEVHDVIARFGRAVRDVQSSIFVVLALDLGLAGTFDGQRETAVAGLAGVDVEGVVRVCFAFQKGLATDDNLLGIADFAFAHLDLEWRTLDVFAQSLDRDVMVSDLTGSERNAEIAVGKHFQEARLFQSGRRLDGGVQSADIGIGNPTGQRHFAIGADRDLIAFATLSGDLGGVGASADVLVGVLDRHLVLAGC